MCIGDICANMCKTSINTAICVYFSIKPDNQPPARQVNGLKLVKLVISSINSNNSKVAVISNSCYY